MSDEERRTGSKAMIFVNILRSSLISRRIEDEIFESFTKILIAIVSEEERSIPLNKKIERPEKEGFQVVGSHDSRAQRRSES